MSNWKETFKDLGKIKVGTTKAIKFKMINIVEVEDFKSSCGCTKPEFNKNTGELTLKYKVGKFPVHLIHQKSYQSVKWVTVIYPNGVEERLTFKAEIIK